jgi:hypothetical protein
MVVEEEDKTQTKGIDNLFNRIIAENFPNLKKESYPGAGSLQNTKPSGPKQKHHNQNTEHKEQRKNSGAEKEKRQITYKGKSIRKTADLSTQTLNARRLWKDIIQALKESNC